MKITILPTEYEGLPEFYDVIAEKLGYSDTSELQYDCRKINVAPNIQDSFFVQYREAYPDLSESDLNVHVGMLLVCSGPKMDATLKENEVEVFDGFVC